MSSDPIDPQNMKSRAFKFDRTVAVFNADPPVCIDKNRPLCDRREVNLLDNTHLLGDGRK